MRTKFKVGKAYYIQFLDHIKGHDKPLKCQVLAWIVQDKSEHLVCTWWEPLDDDVEMVANNRELLTIIKSTIIRKKQLLVP